MSKTNKRYKLILYINQCALLLLFAFISSCGVQKNIKSGKAAFDLKQYSIAVGMLEEEYTDSNSKVDQATKAFLLGQSYGFLLKSNESLQWYQKAEELGYGIRSTIAVAYALKTQGAYAQSLAYFKKLMTYKTLEQEARKEIGNLNLILANQAEKPKGVFTKITKISDNTLASAYAPVYFGEDKIVFTSDKMDATGPEIDNWSGNKHSDLFIMSKFGGPAQLFDQKFATPNNEGSAVFNKTQTEVFYTQCVNSESERDNICKIMYSQKVGETWNEPIVLPINKRNLNYGQPVLVESDSVLIFVAKSETGDNGFDLWYCDRFDGEWSEPLPMPDNINTQGNEYFPTADGDTLYFSSDFHPGLGGLDIFKTWLSDGKWVNPVPLSPSINSRLDDFSYRPDPSFTPSGRNLAKAIFSSNRAGLGYDDIYVYEQFSVEERPTVPINADTALIAVVPKKDPTPISTNTEVKYDFPIYIAIRVIDASTKQNTFLRPKPVPRASVQMQMTDTSPNQFQTDRNGLAIKDGQGGTNYTFTVGAEGFLTNQVKLSTILFQRPPDGQGYTFNVEIALQPIVRDKEFVLDNIYYDLDKYDIRNDARPTLDSLANILKLNPALSIELGSHTDCRGDDPYNLDLSQKRADSAVKYLITRGIEQNRLTAKGYGETNFANNCACEECSEAEHQQNRRTTFKIL